MFDWKGHINGLIVAQYSDLLVGRVADFGCGDGHICEILAKNNGITEVIGIDINLGSTVRNPKVKYIQADLREFSLPDPVDNAISFHTLEHICEQDLNVVLQRFRLVIVPDGHIVVSVPYDMAYYMPDHVSFFTTKKLTALFETNGFKTVECYRDKRKDNYGNKHNCITGVFQNGK